MDLLTVLQRTIAIPSWRSPDNPDAEVGVAGYLSSVIERHLPFLHVTNQHVAGNRFNVYATDGEPPRALFIGHLDTVPPGMGWRFPVSGERSGDRFYGRGTFDTKGGIIALLAALEAVGPTHGVGVLLYCDEEYDFHGMRAFLTHERGRIQPDIAIALEPTQLRVRTGCRGVAEFHPVVHGKRGHAARPWTGRSAFLGFLSGLHALDQLIDQHAHDVYGRMTYNVAALTVGQIAGRVEDRVILAEDGNIIPDYAKGVIEVRTLPGMDVDECIAVFGRGVVGAGAELAEAAKRFDFRGFYTEPAAVRVFTDAVREELGNIEYEEIGESGYSDVQLLATQLKVPCAIIGPSGGNMHALDEYVDLTSVHTLQAIFERFLRSYRVSANAARVQHATHEPS